jgi:hypothetical protein
MKVSFLHTEKIQKTIILPMTAQEVHENKKITSIDRKVQHEYTQDK